MENKITLVAENLEALNEKIEEKIKQGYLLQGGASINEEDKHTQLMTQANNIDSEMTMKSGVKLFIGIVIYAVLMYFIL